jgi:hypothetical protein
VGDLTVVSNNAATAITNRGAHPGTSYPQHLLFPSAAVEFKVPQRGLLPTELVRVPFVDGTR